MDYIDKLNKHGLTPDKYESCLNTIIDKKNRKKPFKSWVDIVDDYGITGIAPEALRQANGSIFGGAFVADYIRNHGTADGDTDIDDTEAETTMNKDGSWTSRRLMVMNNEQEKDPEFILNAHGFEPAEWQIISLRNSVRQVISKQDGVVTLYASFLTVKPVTGLTTKKVEEFYKELLDNYPSPKVRKKHYKKKNGLMLEIPIQDVHFGKLALTEDTADPYDYETAKERFSYVVDEIIESVQGFRIDKIIFPIGNDFFHVDNYGKTTTAGTRQGTDLSPELIFRYGLECLVTNIIKLSELAPVEVFCVNGNHDFLTSYHAICALRCFFYNDANVTVDTGTSPRKYVEYGNVLIGFTHGDKEGKRLEGIMQIEAREAWGRTRYHEIHAGHLHSEQTKEVNGVIIRNLSSFTGTDQWHRDKGYVGALKKNEAFLWDKEKGLKNIIVTIID